MALILDTGPLFATLDCTDAAHRACRRLVEEATEARAGCAPVPGPLESPAVAIPDVATPSGADSAARGVVEGIFIAPVASARMKPVERVRAEAGRGLVGDRYYAAVGTYSDRPGPQREVTLIDAATLDALRAEHGIGLEPGASRRNLVVRGVDLLSLVGKQFRVGGALLEGVRDCPPCNHLESLTQPGVARGLLHRGGLRARVHESGTISVGDAVLPAGKAPRAGTPRPGPPAAD